METSQARAGVNTPEVLRAAAARYRRLIRMVTDQPAIDTLQQLANEYQALAERKESLAQRQDQG